MTKKTSKPVDRWSDQELIDAWNAKKASHGCFRLDGNLQPTSRLEALFEVSKDLDKICATLREKPNTRVLGKLDVMLDYCNYALMRCELEHRILNKLISPASIGE